MFPLYPMYLCVLKVSIRCSRKNTTCGNFTLIVAYASCFFEKKF